MIKLSPRLKFVAELAGEGGSVIDVGTDHGYVPVYLAQKGLFKRVAASDIGEGPLQSAKSSAREFGAEDKIELYLSDGLRSVQGRFDTVIIAGMGGETMVDIMSACPWIGGARLVLQPQSKVPELAAWLNGGGFVCREAGLVEDGGRLYTAFLAEAGDGGFDLLGALIRRREPLLEGCLLREKKRILRALEGMEMGGRRETEEYLRLSGMLGAVENAITEVSKWQE